MGLDKDIKDLSGGDCDVPNSAECVLCGCVLSDIYWVDLGFINNDKEPQLQLD